MTAAGLALAALAACDDPAWRNPATSKGSADLAPAVQETILAELAGKKSRMPAKINTAQPLPVLPDWSRPLIGKPLRGPFPLKATCLGNIDGLRARYLGAPSGVMLVGWAWDPRAKAPPARVILVDDSLLIRGAGIVGAPRPGVPKARPEVTSANVGWEALAARVVGPLDAWGVLADGKTICKLGHIDL